MFISLPLFENVFKYLSKECFVEKVEKSDWGKQLCQEIECIPCFYDKSKIKITLYFYKVIIQKYFCSYMLIIYQLRANNGEDNENINKQYFVYHVIKIVYH